MTEFSLEIEQLKLREKELEENLNIRNQQAISNFEKLKVMKVSAE